MEENTVFKLLYPFQAEEDGELSVKEGQIVYAYHDFISRSPETPQGWTLVQNESGEVS